MKKQTLRRDIRFLKIYAVVATLAIGTMLVTGFQASRNQKFAEIDVERINVVEKDGTLRMVLSNQARQHPGIAGGKIIKRTAPREPGILFFNESGESGGLVFDASKNGDKVDAYGGLTFDQYGQDETLRIAYVESNGWRRVGLTVQDRSNIKQPEWDERWEKAKAMKAGPEHDAEMELLSAPHRAFFGKTRENDSGLFLNDPKGRTRVRLMVSKTGEAKLEFLDETGKVVSTYPDAPAKK